MTMQRTCTTVLLHLIEYRFEHAVGAYNGLPGAGPAEWRHPNHAAAGNLMYAQGQLVALRRLRRLLRRTGAAPAHFLALLLSTELDHWRTLQSAYSTEGNLLPNLLSYCQGGFDAGQSVLTVFRTVNAGDTPLPWEWPDAAAVAA